MEGSSGYPASQLESRLRKPEKLKRDQKKKKKDFDSPHRLLWEYELYQRFVLVGSNPGMAVMGGGGVDLGGVANSLASPDKTARFNRGRGCKATLS